METLREVLEGLDKLADHLVVYVPVVGDLGHDTRVVVEDYAGPGQSPVGMKTMLIVEDLKGVLEAWRNSHPGREPSAAEKLAAVAHYVENDAYLP